MLSPADILRLPYTRDLTEGGIAYALRSLAYSFDRADTPPYNQLRRTVANVAVELAFRRHLSQNGIPFEVKAAAPFTDHERFDVYLNNRRCDIKSFFISNRSQITELRRTPETLLNASALVPSDQHARDGHSPADLYIFAFASGLTAASQADLAKAIASGQPHHLVHVMPREWRKPVNWNPLGALTLKSESPEELLVEVSGQAEGRETKRKTVSLPPGTKVTLDESFYSVTALHIRRVPEARVALRCETLPNVHTISPFEWHNLWVYGMDVFLAGFCTHEEFGQRAQALPPNSKTFQYERTHVKNLSMPVAALKPIQRLFE